MLAQAMATPSMGSASSHLSWMSGIDMRPRAPASRHEEGVRRRPRRDATGGRRKAKPNVQASLKDEATPFHSMPSVNRGDDASGAPKTVRATAPGRNNHMQKSPSHVQNWTGA